MISFVVAMDVNRVIGNDNQLPWHLPADLKFFKNVTMGHPIAMGRKTHESISRVLPGRQNIIITRQNNYRAEGCTVFYSVGDFVDYCRQQEDEIFVIGGAEIFKETFPFADRLYITLIHEEFTGDTYFPMYNEKEWQLTSTSKGVRDEKNPYDYEFLVFDRRA